MSQLFGVNTTRASGGRISVRGNKFLSNFNISEVFHRIIVGQGFQWRDTEGRMLQTQYFLNTHSRVFSATIMRLEDDLVKAIHESFNSFTRTARFQRGVKLAKSFSTRISRLRGALRGMDKGGTIPDQSIKLAIHPCLQTRFNQTANVRRRVNMVHLVKNDNHKDNDTFKIPVAISNPFNFCS